MTLSHFTTSLYVNTALLCVIIPQSQSMLLQRTRKKQKNPDTGKRTQERSLANTSVTVPELQSKRLPSSLIQMYARVHFQSSNCQEHMMFLIWLYIFTTILCIMICSKSDLNKQHLNLHEICPSKTTPLKIFGLILLTKQLVALHQKVLIFDLILNSQDEVCNLLDSQIQLGTREQYSGFKY